MYVWWIRQMIDIYKQFDWNNVKYYKHSIIDVMRYWIIQNIEREFVPGRRFRIASMMLSIHGKVQWTEYNGMTGESDMDDDVNRSIVEFWVKKFLR